MVIGSRLREQSTIVFLVCLYFHNSFSVTKRSVISDPESLGNYRLDEPLLYLKYNKQSKNHVFGRLDLLSFIECIVECLSRKHCESVSYHARRHRCELHDTIATDMDLKTAIGFVYINMEPWPQVLLNVNYLEILSRILIHI